MIFAFLAILFIVVALICNSRAYWKGWAKPEGMSSAYVDARTIHHTMSNETEFING
jgi:hypothetical protein